MKNILFSLFLLIPIISTTGIAMTTDEIKNTLYNELRIEKTDKGEGKVHAIIEKLSSAKLKNLSTPDKLINQLATVAIAYSKHKILHDRNMRLEWNSIKPKNEEGLIDFIGWIFPKLWQNRI